LIVSARGLPVLAHPADIADLDELLVDLKKAGLVGIETYYNDYSSGTITLIEKTAQRHELIMTGGSDYHAFGDGIETKIGDVSPPEQQIKQLFALAGRHGLTGAEIQ
ncbi:MAG: PHP domain-containing protein, partial [Dehalococcoidia bacterium]